MRMQLATSEAEPQRAHAFSRRLYSAVTHGAVLAQVCPPPGEGRGVGGGAKFSGQRSANAPCNPHGAGDIIATGRTMRRFRVNVCSGSAMIREYG